jgi:nucleoside phosphorylase
VIPLVGVAGGREQPHALASVLATEAAIAHAIGRQLDRTDAPIAPAPAVHQAITTAEHTIGAAIDSRIAPDSARGVFVVGLTS